MNTEEQQRRNVEPIVYTDRKIFLPQRKTSRKPESPKCRRSKMPKSSTTQNPKNILTDKNISSKKWWRVLMPSLANQVTRVAVIVDGNVGHITAKEKAQAFCNTFAEKCNLQGAQEDTHLLYRQVHTVFSWEYVTFKPKMINMLLRQLLQIMPLVRTISLPEFLKNVVLCWLAL